MGYRKMMGQNDKNKTMLYLNHINYDYLNDKLRKIGKCFSTKDLDTGACLTEHFFVDEVQKFVLNNSISLNPKVMQIYDDMVSREIKESQYNPDTEPDMERE